MRMHTWRVAALLFGSGLSALIYQTVWLREFRLVFGASTAATGAVLAVFMGGLGAGSAWLGKRADARSAPLAFYGNLELGIAVAATLSLPLLWLTRETYIAAGGSLRLGLPLATILRLLLATLVLGAPTLLMGGTLPAAARAVESPGDAGRRRVAILYGVNTLGAVMGTLLATFWMLEAFGNRMTLLAAALLNALVGLAARRMSQWSAGVPTGAGEESAGEDPSAALRAGTGAPPRSVIFAAAAVAGFSFLLMELVWYRMLAPLLGGTTFTFGLILAVALLGTGLGGIAYAAWSRASVAALALTAALEALFVIAPFVAGDRLAIFANLLRPLGGVGFEGYVIGWTAITALVVLPASIVAGFQFPLIIALLGRGRDGVGRDVGLAYAWNTAGAIAGSLAGGFGLLPLLEAPGAWRTVVVVLALLSMSIVVMGRRGVAAALIALLALTGTFATGPTAAWRHSGTGGGRLRLQEDPNRVRETINSYRRRLLWEADGRESSIALLGGDDLWFMVNGKSDGTARTDAGTQVMMGMVGALLHPNPRSALVIGLGTGTTAGWLGAVPSIERVNVVELEPAVEHVARVCAPVNRNVLENSRVRLIFADAREVLLADRGEYDLIVSEPSNPYRSGVASLFTTEFYAAAASRLAADGIFLQWLQAYDIDSETLRTIYATMNRSFPYVDTFYTMANDLLLVGTREPLTYDVDRLRKRLSEEPYRSAITYAWRVETAEGFLSHVVANEATAAFMASSSTADNTDDRPVIEFGLGRLVSSRSAIARSLAALAARRHEDLPVRIRGSFDARTVALNRAASHESPAPVPSHPEPFARRWLMNASASDDIGQAGAIWARQPWQPVNSEEVAAVGEALAEQGDERATGFATALSNEIESNVILARLAFRQRQYDRAADLLRLAFDRYQRDPWPSPARMRRALHLTIGLARTAPNAAVKVMDAVSRPFAARQNDETREVAALAIAVASEPPCGPRTMRLLLSMEPHPPWERDHLAMRANCYARAGPADLAARAAREHAQFLAVDRDLTVN